LNGFLEAALPLPTVLHARESRLFAEKRFASRAAEGTNRDVACAFASAAPPGAVRMTAEDGDRNTDAPQDVAPRRRVRRGRVRPSSVRRKPLDPRSARGTGLHDRAAMVDDAGSGRRRVPLRGGLPRGG